MNFREIFNVIGVLLILLSALFLVPLIIALTEAHPALSGSMTETAAFAWSALLAGAAGLLLWKLLPHGIEILSGREGFIIVVLAWILIAGLGALPFWWTGYCPDFTDAYFESMSGFTATGATVLTGLDTLPKGLLFWRSLTQWLGGMGIIMLFLAVFPVLGIGAVHLFRAEFPGAVTVDRMQPHLMETARILWQTYVILTLVEAALLMLGGMSWFDAFTHAFTTLSTGGFSPHDSNIRYFQSVYIEGVVLVFMVLAAVNYSLHQKVVQGQWREAMANPELRFYLGLLGVMIAICAWGVFQQTPDEGMTTAVRKAAFTVVSLNTTTGFTNHDYDQWPHFLKPLLLLVMFIGGCSGSTSGSTKCIRIMLLLKTIYRELFKLVQPHAVVPIKVGGKPVDPDHLFNAICLAALYSGMLLVSITLLMMNGLDSTTALSAAFACIFNVGPGMGRVGPSFNYALVPLFGKWVLIGIMLMGRLEIYGFLLFFFPLTWRK